MICLRLINLVKKKTLLSTFNPQERKWNTYVTLVYVFYDDLQPGMPSRNFSGIQVNPTLSLRSLTHNNLILLQVCSVSRQFISSPNK